MVSAGQTLSQQSTTTSSLWFESVDWFQFVMLFFGGWACILVSLVISLPILFLGLLIYSPLKRRFGTLPQKTLERPCELCGAPAVGYKDLHVTTGMLFASRRFSWSGFLCELHTTEFATRAKYLNLLGMILLFGTGVWASGAFFKACLQATRNLRIAPNMEAEHAQANLSGTGH
jgi:hypothetical protein